MTTSWINKLTRGWHNERTARGNATTSWRDKMTTGQRNERTARGDATTSWRDKTTRGRHNEGTTRDNATTSWHDETTPGWRDERRHNLEVVRLQTDSVGKVAAMDSSYRVYTRTIVCWRQIAASQRCGGPKWTDNFEASQGYASQNGTPLCQGVRMPQQILASKGPSDENISIVAAVNFSINNNAS